MNYLKTYCEKVLSGKIVACKKVKQQLQSLYDDLDAVDEDGYYFDLELANKPIQFIQTFCCLPSGKSNTPFRLELFQKALIQAVFGFVHKETKLRRFQKVLIMLARKNGKSSLLSVIALYMLMADGEYSPQICMCATTRDQAKLCFDASHKVVMQSSILSSHIKKRASDLYFKANHGTIKALASRSNSLDGLDIHLGILDELAAHKTREVFDLVVQAISARQQPLIFSITTNGFVRKSIFDDEYEYGSKVLNGEIYDRRSMFLFYELDDYEEWDNPDMFIKANPGLGTIKKLSYMHEVVEKAKNDDSFKATVMTKEFNMKQSDVSSWLNYNDIVNENKFDYKTMGFRYLIGGMDFAEVDDLFASTAFFMRPNDENIYSISMYWMPEDSYETRLKEGVLPLQQWVEKDYLRICPGNKNNPELALMWFKELQELDDIYVYKIGYDPWHIDVPSLDKFKSEFGKDSMKMVRQGIYTLSMPMKEFKTRLQAGNIVHNSNPITLWCYMNTKIKTDINGNIQPIKGTDKNLKIDGTISSLCAYVQLRDNFEDYSNLI